MKLQEVFDQLSAGEFSQLSIGGANAGVLDAGNYSKVIGHVNLALTALYTRFNLKERRLAFTLNPASDTYQLNVEDMLKISQVLTDSGFSMALNVGSDIYSCHTPTLTTLRVPQIVLDQGSDLPDELKTEKLEVVYWANHPKIKMLAGVLKPAEVEIELPYSHLTPLLYFVASRVHNPIGMSAEFNAGNRYYAKYEEACRMLEQQGIQVSHEEDTTRFERNGWV